MIAGAQQAMQREIQGIGGIVSEYDSRRVAGAYCIRDFLAAGANCPLDFRGFGVAAASRRRAELPLIVIDRAIDSVRLGPARRGVVEIDASHWSFVVGRLIAGPREV